MQAARHAHDPGSFPWAESRACNAKSSAAASAQTSAAQPKPARLAPIVSACASSSVYSGTVPASARTICHDGPSATLCQPPMRYSSCASAEKSRWKSTA